MALATHKSGFVMSFDNGYEVSVAFGPGNYCSNRQETTLKACTRQQRGQRAMVQCGNAEVIVFLSGGNEALDIRNSVGFGVESWSLMGDGKGLSWANAEQVAALLAWVAKRPIRDDWIEKEAE